MIRACYVCKRITVAGMPTCDRLTDAEAARLNVSHGVCSECLPAETARVELETARILGEENAKAFAASERRAADAAHAATEAQRANVVRAISRALFGSVSNVTE